MSRAPIKGSGRKGKSIVTCEFGGTVTAVNDGSVTVNVKKGNNAARGFEGKNVTVTTDSQTKIKRDDKDTVLSDIQVGDEVKVQSKEARAQAPRVAATTARQLFTFSPGSKTDLERTTPHK